MTRAPGYAIAIDDDALDAARFEELVAGAARAARNGVFVDARTDAEAALALWRGPVLADVSDDFVRDAATRLEELRLTAEEVRLEAMIELGDAAAAAAELAVATEAHPLRERLWELRMLALYRAGRQGDALRVFQTARERLLDELGIEPGPALADLERAVLDQSPDLAPAPVAATPAPSTRRAATVEPDERLVGRAAETAVIDHAIAVMRSGDTAWIVLVGEAGIGKTSLADEAARRANTDVVRGHAHDDEGAPPLWPWVQVVRALGDPELPDLDAVPTAGLDGDAARFRQQDAVVQLLRRATAAEPLVVVIEDLHWADVATVRMLEFLAVELRDAPCLVVITVRAGESTPAVDALLGKLERHPGAVRLDLAGLTGEDVRELAARVASRDLAGAELDALVDRTQGNPLFVTELARLLERDGTVNDIPPGVREVIRQRIARLPEEAQAVLPAAAVAGRAFEIDVLEHASRIDGDRLYDLLDATMVTGIVQPAATGFRFGHALVRDALLADIPPLRRARTHAQVAEAIAAVHASDIDDWAADIAGHYVAARSVAGPGPAVDWAQRAAAVATRRLAYEDAVRWLEVVLEEERTGAHLLEMARAKLRASDPTGASETIAVAVDQLDAENDTAGMVDAVCMLASLNAAWPWPEMRVTPTDLIERCDRTLQRIPPDDAASRSSVLATLASGWYYGDPTRAVGLSREAVAAARELDDPKRLAFALRGHAVTCYQPERIEEQIAAIDEYFSLPSDSIPPEDEAAMRVLAATIALTIGDYERTTKHITRARTIADDLATPMIRAQVMTFDAGLATFHGDSAAGERIAEEAFHLFERTTMANTLGSYVAQVLWARWEVGRAGEMLEVMEHVLPDINVIPVPWIGVTLAQAGQLDRLREFVASDPMTPYDDWVTLAENCERAIIFRAIDDSERGRVLYDELLPYRDRIAVLGVGTFVAGPVAYFLGLLAEMVDPPAAPAHFERALELLDGANAPRWEARVRAALGVPGDESH